jgi:hypothetical protein
MQSVRTVHPARRSDATGRRARGKQPGGENVDGGTGIRRIRDSRSAVRERVDEGVTVRPVAVAGSGGSIRVGRHGADTLSDDRRPGVIRKQRVEPIAGVVVEIGTDRHAGAVAVRASFDLSEQGREFFAASLV